jgi:hypothetical protein
LFVLKHRTLTYVTVLFTLLLPLMAAVWARSYLHTETFYRVGNGRGVMLNCGQGEVALWAGPTRVSGPTRWGHETSADDMTITTRDAFAMDRSATAYWGAGFGYAESYAMAPREHGPLRCYVVPLWFLTALLAVMPARVVLRHVKRNQAAVEAETARCRRCGEQMEPGETRCHACSFPAFIRRGVVA